MLRFQTDISLRSIVLFDHETSTRCGVIIQEKKGKYVVLDERGSKQELTPSRMKRLKGQISTTSETEVAQQLRDLKDRALSEVTADTISDLWDLTSDEASELSEDELAVMYFGDQTSERILGLRLRLIEDGVFFKRTKLGFIPRTPSAVAELRTNREKNRAKAEQRNAAVTRCIEVLKNRFSTATGEPDAIKDRLSEEELGQFAADIDALAEYAAWGANLEGPLGKHAKQVLNDIKKGLGSTWDAVKLPDALQHQEEAFAILVGLGIFSRHQNLALIRYRPPLIWGADDLELANNLVCLDTAEDIREDLTNLPTFTIDDATTMDMDDAFSVVQTQDGYQVGIHISDVAAFVPMDSSLDRGALYRASTIYNPAEVIHMFPENLAEQMFSLAPGVERHTVSLLIELDRNLVIQSRRFLTSKIRSARKYSYEEIDVLLDEDSPPFDLLILSQLAAQLEAERMAKGASAFNRKEILLYPPTDINSDVPVIKQIDMNSPSRRTVSELMVLFNTVSARVMADLMNPYPFRHQAASEENPEINLDVIPEGPARDFAIRSNMKRSEISTTPSPHYSLALDVYTQVTSPIRRYLDLVAQRQLKAAISGQPLPYDEEALQRLFTKTADSLGRVNAISKESRRYWLLQYLRQMKIANQSLDGVVIRNDARGTLVEIEELGFTHGVRPTNPPPLGSHVTLKLTAVAPRVDYLRMQVE